MMLFIGFMAAILPGLQAQEKADFIGIDSETYRLYLEAKWDSLIIVGTHAIRLEVDYYYLRMRIGIAHYNKKNFRGSIHHFIRALEMNQDDPVALEYLYYARLLAGQTEAAWLVREQFKGEIALRLPPVKGKFADRIHAEYLFSLGAGEGALEISDMAGISVPGIQYVTRRFQNASMSLTNRISPGVSLKHAFNFLYKANEYLSFDGLTGIYTPEQYTNQMQYYISPVFNTRSGFSFEPMLHLIHIKYQIFVEQGSGYQGGYSQPATSYLSENDFVTGFEMKKCTGPLDIHLGAFYGSLNLARQIQGRFGLTWFPRGNLNLYAGAYLNTQYEYVPDEEGVVRYIPELMLGFSLSGKIWFDLSASAGEMTNYLENNGSIVFNSYSEVMTRKFTFIMSVPVTDQGSLLYLGARWTANRSQFQPTDPARTEIINPFEYNALAIYGGISWKF
jgi:hypothetical protein